LLARGALFGRCGQFVKCGPRLGRNASRTESSHQAVDRRASSRRCAGYLAFVLDFSGGVHGDQFRKSGIRTSVCRITKWRRSQTFSFAAFAFLRNTRSIFSTVYRTLSGTLCTYTLAVVAALACRWRAPGRRILAASTRRGSGAPNASAGSPENRRSSLSPTLYGRF
jgi:hypothetical protein